MKVERKTETKKVVLEELGTGECFIDPSTANIYMAVEFDEFDKTSQLLCVCLSDFHNNSGNIVKIGRSEIVIPIHLKLVELYNNLGS